MAYGYSPPHDPTEVMGRRIGAYLIDVVLLAVISLIVFATAKHTTLTGAPSNACTTVRARSNDVFCSQVGSRVYLWKRSVLFRNYGIGAAAGFLDVVLLQSITGASIGKLCVGLRVVDQQGDKAGFLRMLGRWLLLVVDGLCFLVGLITALATHPHRRVGDFVCGTFVVDAASVGRPVLVGSAMAYAPPPGYGPPPGWAPPSGPPPAPTGWSPPGAPPPPPPWEQPAPSPPPAAPPPTAWQQPPPPTQWGAPASTPPGPAPSAAPPPPPPPPPPVAPPAAPAGPTSGGPPQWSAPPPRSAPPAPPASAAPAGPAPGSEAWWDKALGADDESDADPA